MAGFHTKTFMKHDDYMTPDHAWKDIEEYIPKDKIIYEAFYGDGESGITLQAMGCNVIHEERDFYDEPPEYDLIITNPPFSDTKNIMKRLAELDKPFIMIMPSSKINTSYFRESFANKIQIMIPRRRIHFIKIVDGKKPDNSKNACNFDCFYYCYKMNLKDDITWLE